MAKISLKAELSNGNGGKINAGLELYIFTEDNMYILYCPALDLSSYGRTEQEAKDEFLQSFQIYINYCMSKNTLAKDLQKHGWKVRSSRQKRMKSPSTKEMIDKNATLRDIIYNKEYKKVSECIKLPELV